MTTILEDIDELIHEAQIKEDTRHYHRSNIKVGATVDIIEKHNQRIFPMILTRGIVKRILTSKPRHTRGIKVMLETGTVGRVQKIISEPKEIK